MAKQNKKKLEKQLSALHKELTKTLSLLQGNTADLNPQPLPPGKVKAKINPQPLPPSPKPKPKAVLKLNPQPLPPRK